MKPEKKSLRERVEESTNMQRKIAISFPVKVARKFEEYCQKNSADCYWLGIEQLMNFAKEQKDKDTVTKILMERDDTNFKILKDKIKALESDLESLRDELRERQEKKRKTDTFGGGRKDE